MPNPYLARALREQQERRKSATKTPAAPAPGKAATSAEKSDTQPSDKE